MSPVWPMTTKSSDLTALTLSQKGLRCPGTYGLCLCLATTPSRPRSRHASTSSTPSSRPRPEACLKKPTPVLVYVAGHKDVPAGLDRLLEASAATDHRLLDQR